MAKKKKYDVKVNPLKVLYMENQGRGTIDPKALLDMDLTALLKYSIITTIQNQALLNVALRGEVTTGKSSVGCWILKIVIDELIRSGQLNFKNQQEYDEYLFKHIKSDQTEYLRFTLEDESNTCVLIDEFSSLGETGLNATTEQAMYEENSNLFAQKFVHKISCSPNIIADKNVTIILDVIGKDRKNKTTQVKVTYRDVITRIPLTLGVAYIPVGEILDTKWYDRYRIKKFKRMDLLDKHGVRNIKELEFSQITLGSFKELKDGCRIKKFNNEVILSVVDGVRRKYKMVYSLFTLNFVVMSVKTLVELQSEVYKFEDKITLGRTEKISEAAKQQYKIFKKLLDNRLGEEEKKIQILEDYRNIQ